MKNLIYLLGFGVLAVVAYKFLMRNEDGTIITDPPTNSYLQTQPEQKYPLQAVETPRVDNADQPWYGGSRSFMGVTIDALEQGDMGASTSLDYNTNELWLSLGSQYSH